MVGERKWARLAKTKITPEEYLEMERKAEFKSEYFGGKVYDKVNFSDE